ncbi:MAG: hypothetical protein G01um101433_809 [Parcubacteria group bacterium Gr01-1014_33]|nr:MAG: hypothetical protein G01um101433_809 [Parcubacteria group bacterium Gr01-1014_33]
MNPVFAPSFVRDYQRLPKKLQRRFDRTLEFFLTDFRHPSLRTKKMEGQFDHEGRDIWEARVTKSYRFTFIITNGTYIFYRIGSHDIERRPR